MPIICAIASIFLGAAMYFIWPHFQAVISAVGGLVDKTGYIGTLIYGFVLRMLRPFGPHHIFYLPFWITAPGGSEIVNGQLIEGTQRIFFAELGDPSVKKFFEGTSRFMSGRFITMMFELIGAAFAMHRTSKPKNKKIGGGMLLSAVAQLAHIFQITIGQTFSGGLISVLFLVQIPH